VERRGFEPADEYVVLARRTVRLVKSPNLLPTLVKPTLG